MPVILIADDEKNIRAGIRKILTESLPGDVVYQEAKNGEEALDLAGTGGADILITDIRMPKMDGIELMRKIRTELKNDDMEIIVLSGYDDFSYAQEAITFRASSYIVKPVDKRDLVSIVLKTLGEIEGRKQQSLERSLRKIVETGNIPAGGIPLEISPASPRYFILSSAPEDLSGPGLYVIEQQPRCRVILAGETEKNHILSRSPSAGYRALSGPCQSLAGLVTGWKQLRIACFSRFLSGETLLQYREPGSPFVRSAETEMRKLTGSLGILGTGPIKKQVEALFSLEDIPAPHRAEYLYSLHEWHTVRIAGYYRDYIAGDMYLARKLRILENVYLLSSLDEWKRNFSDFVLYLNFLLKKGRSRYAFIDQALVWIGDHFTEDINMAMAANQVSVNYTYFSEKFKEHTGINFNEYVKRLRIGAAMRLLETGNFRVYEAALHSGYSDVKYFIKSFKEVTGGSPGAYRQKKTKNK
ncbi:hypothetical protein AGMMS49928_11580 [Spirochaetia bacterium]|nr:hypothetical protein AGMMS49928_11580 [Spirochaetia bacterium]